MENLKNEQENLEKSAIVFIKPGFLDKAGQIIRRLEHEGFLIQKRVRKVLPERFVDERSENFPHDIQRATGEYLTMEPSEIILLKGGNDIVEKLKAITGENTNPGKSNPDSLRSKFGEHFARKTDEGGDFFRNVIHRPTTEEERVKDLEDFRDIL